MITCPLRLPARLPAAVVVLVLVTAAGCSDGPTAEEARRQRENEARKLTSLSYVTQAPVRAEHRGLSGVVTHDRARASAGLNLYGSLTGVRAVLRDMDGEVVHRWTAEDVFDDRRTFPVPGSIVDVPNGPVTPGMIVAELHGNALWGIESHVGLVKLDRDSNVLLAVRNGAHHDLDVAPDGSVLVLTATPRRIDTGSGGVLVIDDVIQHLAPDGRVLAEHSIFRILSADPATRPFVARGLEFARHWFGRLDEWQAARAAELPGSAEAYEVTFRLYDEVFVQGTRELAPNHRLFVLYATPADILHTNTLQVLPAHPAGLWPEGCVLVSIRQLDLVAVLDLAEGRVRWWYGPGELSRQHQPSLLADGHVLVFDNGTARGRSRVVEIDPVTKEITWSWGEKDGQRIFTGAMGGAQGLPGGNVLITESGSGRALEVDRAGDVVWEFFNPEQGHNPFDPAGREKTIEAIYRVTRVPAQAFPPVTKP